MPRCVYCWNGIKKDGTKCEYCDGTGYWEKDNPF